MNNFNDSFANYLPKQEPLHQAFTKANAQQVACFRAIDSKCNYIEDSIESLLKTISRLQTKMSMNAEMSDKYRMGQLREKQKQFIITQLQQKLKRLETSQETLQTLLMEKQSIVFQLQDKCQQLRNDNAQLKQELSKKTKQIKQLIKANSSLKMSMLLNENKKTEHKIKQSTPNLSQLSAKKQEIKEQNEYYQQLQSKLKQMQDCLNGEIQQYKKKNEKLQQEIRQLNVQLKKQSGNTRKIYELQLRIKNISNENKELEESYTNQLALNNENQAKFLKKINELKNQTHQHKKNNKLLIKQCEKELRKLSAAVLGSHDKPTIFIGVTTPSQQFAQLAKQIIKCHKKQIMTITYEKDALLEQLKMNLQSSQSKIKELNALIQKMKQQQKNQKIDKSPVLNGYSVTNKSTSKSDLQIRQSKQKDKANQKIQQKYEQIIQQHKIQLQQKEKIINQMRKKNDEDFTKMATKNLQMEAKLAELEMQMKYNDQKYSKIQISSQEAIKNSKAQKEKEISKLKEKIKQLQTQRDQLKTKIRQVQQKIYGKDKTIRQIQKREKETNQKIKKQEKKSQIKLNQYKIAIESKDKIIQEMISKNQNLSIEVKLLQQKNRMIQSNLNSLKSIPQPDTPTFSPIDKIKKQFFNEKQDLLHQITNKDQQLQALKIQLQEKKQNQKRKQQKISQLSLQVNKLSNDYKLLKNQNQVLKQTGEKMKTSKTNQNTNNFSQLRLEYEKREKISKAQAQKAITQAKNFKKQLQEKNRKIVMEITQLKDQNSKLKLQISKQEQQHLKFDAEKFRDSQRQRKMVTDHQKKISQLNSKISQLQSTANHNKNKLSQKQPIKKGISFSNDKENKKIFKGTDSVEYVEFGIMTEKIIKIDQVINTIDIFALQTNNQGNNNILDFNDNQPEDLNTNHLNSRQQERLRNSNLFMNLNQGAPANDDVFQICDENQEINFGQSSTNLQFREMFTSLRIQIQKLFNEEEISLAVTKLLPQALQDDYFELMSYIKQKIAQIKVNNQISFIMAEPGNEPQHPLQDSIQFPQLCRRHSEGQNLKKVIEQKDALINSLMNERTSQQNTINQLTMEKQQIQEQNENRFMNQCNVYKKQIKEHKKQIDIFEMNFQSMKNVIRNVLEAYSTDEDMEDDFRESMTMYAKVAKLSQKERSRINFYIQCYMRAKGLDGTN